MEHVKVMEYVLLHPSEFEKRKVGLVGMGRCHCL